MQPSEEAIELAQERYAQAIHWEDKTPLDAMRAALQAALPLLVPEGWRSIESAPRDGTPILAWCVHPNARYAGDDKDWMAPVVTQWTTFNGGGWTWHGMAGQFTHWQPLPAPPGSTEEG